MILKIAEGHNESAFLYIEGKRISIRFDPDLTLQIVGDTPSLVFDAPEHFGCHHAFVDGEPIYFNTPAYVMNDQGKTIDRYPSICYPIAQPPNPS